MKSKLRALLTFLIGWPLSFVALFFIIRLMMPHKEEIEKYLQNINPTFIILGFLCFFLYFFFRSYAYQKILNFLGYPLSMKDCSYHWSQSELHRYIPGNIWSFLGRTVLFSKKNVTKGDIATSLIIESQLVLLGTLAVTLLCVPFLIRIFATALPYREFLPLLSVLVGGGILYLYIYSKKYSHRLKYRLISRIFLTPFSVRENCILLLLSVICYSFFGLGYYFIFSSILFLHPQMVWELTGFFAFSLLVGYASLLTPTGLGIREGILIFGLRSVAPVAVVGFASIFTRLILIFSEIFFLFVSYLWYRMPFSFFKKAEDWVAKNKHEVILSILITIYSVYFSVTSFLRYDHFYTGRFDLGNMAQTVWNTMHGRVFELTDPNGTEIVSRLAFHADFMLILLTPFYFLWTDPRMLLLIQTVVVSCGAIFVYLLARDVLKGKSLPLLIASMYLLNPSLQRANLYDFHAVTLATTLLLGAFYFLQKKRYGVFLVFLFLAALTKEQVWLIVAMFGIYLAAFKKQFILGGVLLVAGLGICGFLISSVIPNAAGSRHFALSYYSDFGEKPTDIAKNIILSPHKTLPILFEEDRQEYFQQLAGPLGFMVIFAPFYLLFAAGDLGINLLSSNPQLHQIYYQYTATITPFLFIALIFALKRFLVFFPQVSRMSLAGYLLLLCLYTAFLYGPLPGARGSNLDMYTKPLKNAKEIDAIIRKIPISYSVSAPNNLASHFSHREKVYVFPQGMERADIVAFLYDPTTPQSSGKQQEALLKLQFDPSYLKLYELDGFIVFKKIEKFATMEE